MDGRRQVLREHGAKYLTDKDLVAEVLGAGEDTVNELLKGGVGEILGMTFEDLSGIAGIGKAKASQLLCIAELSRRMWKAEHEYRTEFSTPEAVADYYMQEMRSLEVEELHVMFLDTRNRLLGEKMMTRGTVNMSVFSAREILIEALRRKAVNIAMVHNHPTGDTQPSKHDQEATESVKKACDIVGVRLIDHVIIGRGAYYSFHESGEL